MIEALLGSWRILQ